MDCSQYASDVVKMQLTALLHTFETLLYQSIIIQYSVNFCILRLKMENFVWNKRGYGFRIILKTYNYLIQLEGYISTII